MKLAVVTRSDANIREISSLTHPLLRRYASKCNADFIVLGKEPLVWTNDHRPHYRILECSRLLEIYDRLLLLDTDMLILPRCPNAFDEVPYDCIGSIHEDKGVRRKVRLQRIQDIQSAWGDIGWKDGYTNAGTFVISKCHNRIFDSYGGQYWLKSGSVDLHVSYMARRNGYKFHELSYKWNHMTMFSEEWNGFANRFDSYIIHYAGRGIFDKDISDRVTQIKRDIKIITG